MEAGAGGINLALIQAAPSAVVAMDPEGRVTALNPAAERLFSTSSQEAVGAPYTAVFGPSLSSRMLGLFVRGARSGDPANTEVVEATLPGGGRATLRANVGPLRDAGGELVGMLFVAEDRTAAVEQSREGHDRAQHLRDALQRYVGDNLAAMVDARPSFIGVGGVRQVITVVHADVRGYTTLAEEMAPEQVMQLLLRYHSAAVAALEAEVATINRFIGDAVLAFWNAPSPQPEHARMAVRAALDLQARTRAVGDELAYGVGIHTGEAVVGNLGSEQYMNYTAIGDTVNVAARLQSAAPAGTVVCSSAAAQAVGAGLRSQPLGELQVKGRKSPVDAHQVEGLDS